MAQIKFSALVSDFKGKLNGSIFSSSSKGNFVRNRKSIKSIKSPASQQAKFNLGRITSQWKTLSLAQMQSFENLAEFYQTPNKFGDMITPSPYLLYSRLNNNLNLIGVPLLTDAQQPEPEINVNNFRVTEALNGRIRVRWGQGLSEFVYPVVYVSKPQSNGVLSFPSTVTVLLNLQAPTPNNNLVNNLLLDKFASIQNGQKFFFKMDMIDIRTGQRYGNFTSSITLQNQ